MKKETASEGKNITISVGRFESLIRAERVLNQLKCNGVTNWEGYNCMCDGTVNQSCVFCEETHIALK